MPYKHILLLQLIFADKRICAWLSQRHIGYSHQIFLMHVTVFVLVNKLENLHSQGSLHPTERGFVKNVQRWKHMGSGKHSERLTQPQCLLDAQDQADVAKNLDANQDLRPKVGPKPHSMYVTAGQS